MPETHRDRPARYSRSISMPSKQATSALLGEIGDLGGLRVLVLGSMVAETLSALTYTECRRAETCMPGCQTEAHSADLALVPHLTSENVDRVVSQAAHALSRHGRIVIALPTQGREFVAHSAMMLIGVGFALPVLRGEGEQRVLLAHRTEHLARA